MPFVLEPSAPIGAELPRVVRKRLRGAIRLLDEVDHERPADVDRVVHGVRMRCKEVRAAARLVRPALGKEYDRFNATVREAADLLAPIRDAYVTTGTFERLAVPAGTDDRPSSDAGPAGTDAVAERLAAARTLLKVARSRVKKWKLDDDFDTFRTGLHTTYRRGRKGLRRLRRAPSDELAHEWRTSVKHLWYQVRLLERAAPSVLGPFRARLDDLAQALGDDHDLAMLIDELTRSPERYGGRARADEVRRVAEAEQAALRNRAIRLGATLYGEGADAFVDRLASYWSCTRELGTEPTPARPDDAAEAESPSVSAPDDAETEAPTTIERERKYLVARLPVLPAEGVQMRQGYLAIDGTVAVRVRDDGCGTRTLTIKAGHGAVRTELEWAIDEAEFAAAWGHTRGRRIRKTRYRVRVEEHIAELDVFHEDLEGLVVVEVEFESDHAMAAFVPPSWFGTDVTDDESFTNAALATYALPGRR